MPPSKNSRSLPGHYPAHTSCWDKASNIPTSAVNIELPAFYGGLLPILPWFIIYYLLQYPEIPSGSHEIFPSEKLIKTRNFS